MQEQATDKLRSKMVKTEKKQSKAKKENMREMYLHKIRRFIQELD